MNRLKHTIICGDSTEILKDMEYKSIDLIVTDPPYGLKIGGSGKMTEITNYSPVLWDNKTLSKEQLKTIFRVSKNQVIFGYNYISDILPGSRCIIVWDKKCRNNWNDNFSDGELIWTSFDKPLKIFRHLWMGALRGTEKRKGNRVHPTQKPVKLLEYILLNFSNIGTIILDPFLGSGRTLVAAERLNRNSIGIDISKEWCEKSYERLLREVKQRKLDRLSSIIEKVGF